MSDNQYHNMFWEAHRQNEELRIANAALRAEVERLQDTKDRSPYCHFCRSCGDDGCCRDERCELIQQKAEIARLWEVNTGLVKIGLRRHMQIDELQEALRRVVEAAQDLYDRCMQERLQNAPEMAPLREALAFAKGVMGG